MKGSQVGSKGDEEEEEEENRAEEVMMKRRLLGLEEISGVFTLRRCSSVSDTQPSTVFQPVLKCKLNYQTKYSIKNLYDEINYYFLKKMDSFFEFLTKYLISFIFS